MGMRENWQRFVDLTKEKRDSHQKYANYWQSVHTILSLGGIFFSAMTTGLALIAGVPPLATAGIAGVTTLISTITAFMRASERSARQQEAAKEFGILMLKMVRCETEKEYENLWKELNNAISDEPVLPKNLQPKRNIDWEMTPELDLVINQREREMEMLDKLDEQSVQMKTQESMTLNITQEEDIDIFMEEDDEKTNLLK